MATHDALIDNLRTATLGEQVRGSMIQLFEEDYNLVKQGIAIGSDITSALDSTTGYFDGNVYINKDTLDIWKVINSVWTLQGNLKGVASVDTNESTADSGTNTVTFTLTDGTTYSLNVKNGSKGSIGYGITNAVDNGDGTFYLTIANGDRTNNIATVKGDKGDKGDKGSTGASGRDVTSITMTGTGKQHPVTAYYSDGTASTIGILQDGADGSGGGDMYKATYDTDDSGIVDWANGLSDGTNTIPLASVATKSSSLAGYGITDAYTKTEVDNIVGDLDATDVEYSTGVTVKDKIDGLNATNLEYSTGVSIKSKIDELSTDIVIADDSTAWTSDGNYTAGNTRIYQQKAYECILACDGSVLPTNATYWKELTLSDLAGEVNNLKNNKLPMLKKATLTGSTSTMGYINTGIATTSIRILCAIDTNTATGYVVTAAQYLGKWHLYVSRTSADGTTTIPVKSTSVPTEYYYYDL